MNKRRIEPGPGQESVWDYPRPPRIEDSAKRIRVVLSDTLVADSTRAKRVLETSHPPVYYIPFSDIASEHLSPCRGRSFCEWKGEAQYYSLQVADRIIEKAAWFYPHPSARFADVADYVAFYPSKVDACFVGSEQVVAQEGDFYGGWITQDIVGPFKGAPGTGGW